MRTRFALAATIALAAAAPGLGAQARQGRCVIEFPPAQNVNTRASLTRTPSGGYNQYLGGGMVAVCRAQGMTLRADSAEYYADAGLIYLIGNVHYTEPRTSVDSDRMTYWQNDERLLAEGNVVVTSEDGRELRTEQLRYDQVRNEISSDSAFVATERGGRRVQGVGFVSDPNMNNVRCLSSCSGVGGAVTVPQ